MPRTFYQPPWEIRQEDIRDLEDALTRLVSGAPPPRRIRRSRPHNIFTEFEVKVMQELKGTREFPPAGWITYDLAFHQEGEPYLLLRGWTPSFSFEKAGFKKEYEIELLQIGTPHVDEGGTRYKSVTQEELEFGRLHAGSEKLYDDHRSEIQRAYTDLNQRGVEFIVFRTYRGWPACWDSLHFYSLDAFKDIQGK
ncbi:MAG: hypothetical protein Q7S65_00110 [Nanoarchaeota archaeon]|nr:hypothetical protein [Nanoarchaeota archaeon]